MLHLAGYYQSVDPAGAFVQLAALADSQITVNTPRIQVPPLNQVIAIAGGAESVTIPNMRLVSPSILTKYRQYVVPLNTAVAGPSLPMSPHRVVDLRDDPLILVPSEQLTAELLSNPAAVQPQWCLVLFSDGKPAPVSGPVYTGRAVVANALVVGAWTLNTLVFVDQLPRGRYQIVGFRPTSVNMIASRIIVPGSTWRPGALASVNNTDVAHDMWRSGNLGVWGEFEDVDNLQIESLGAVADAAAIQEYYVDMIQVRSGPG